MVNAEDKQQKIMEFQMMQQQIEQVSQQLEVMNQQLVDLGVSQEALTQIKKTDKETEIMANVAPGIFVKATLKENQKLIVNVGSETTVEKTIPEVIELLEEQKNILQENISQLDVMLQKTAQQAVSIYEEFEKENKNEQAHQNSSKAETTEEVKSEGTN